MTRCKISLLVSFLFITISVLASETGYSLSNLKSSNNTYGDYFNGSGKFLGTDSLNDGKIFIAERWKSLIVRDLLKTGGKENVIKARTASFEIPTLKILKECVDVLERTIENGGLREEISLILENGKIIRGKTGPNPITRRDSKSPESTIPRLPYGLYDHDVLVLIHSHPIKKQYYNNVAFTSSAYKLSPKDRSVLFRYKMNIIVGSLRKGYETYSSSITGFDSDPPLGIVIYYRNTWYKRSLKMRTIKKIIDFIEKNEIAQK